MTIDPIRWCALLLVAVLCTATGWQLHVWKASNDELTRLERKAEADAQAHELIAEIADQTMTAIAGIKVVNTTIYQKTRHEITSNPVYVDCRVPADGMQLINAARSGIDRPSATAALP